MTRPRRRAALETSLAAGTLACAFLAVFGRTLLGEVPFQRDLSALYEPGKRYLAQRLAQGELPHWYPFDALGRPFLANPIFSTFHPTSLLYLALPFHLAFTLQTVSAPILGLVATYRLGRRLRWSAVAASTAGAAYVLSAYFVGFTEYTYASLAAAALPILLSGAIAVRRTGAWAELALGCALMLLAGDGHQVLMALAIVPFVGLRFAKRGRQQLPALAIGLAVGALIAAVQLVPTLALVPETDRHAGVGGDPTRWALTSLDGMNLAWPLARQPLVGLIESTYLGLTTWILAALALAAEGRVRARLAVPALLLGLLALGPLTPLWDLFTLVPLGSSLRYPVKALGPASLLLALLAGAGAQYLVRWMRRRGWRWLAWMLPTMVILDLVLANRQLFRTHPARDDPPSPLAQELIRRGARLGGYYYEDAANGEGFARFLASRGDHGGLSDAEAIRTYAGRGLGPDIASAWGIPTSDSTLPLHLNRYSEWENRFGQAWIDGRSGVFANRFVTMEDAAVDRANVRDRVVARDPEIGLSVVEYPDALPHAYLAATALFRPGALCAATVASSAFRPGEQVVLEGEGEPTLSAGGPMVAADDVRVDGEATWIRVRAPRPSYLVLNESYAKGVTAEVDGTPSPLWAANGLVRATRVEPGEHRVRFAYRAPGLAAGLALSALGLLGLGVEVLRRRRRRAI